MNPLSSATLSSPSGSPKLSNIVSILEVSPAKRQIKTVPEQSTSAEMLCMWDLMWHQRMGLFLAMGFHQLVIAHDLVRVTVGDDAPIVHQHDTVAYLQDEFQIVRGD